MESNTVEFFVDIQWKFHGEKIDGKLNYAARQLFDFNFQLNFMECSVFLYLFFVYTLQILGWADVKEPVCENPYKFSCGNFVNQYRNHELYLINKGEWGSQSHFEYEGTTWLDAAVLAMNETVTNCRD